MCRYASAGGSPGTGRSSARVSRTAVPPDLHASTAFVRWSHEGREAGLITAHLDACNHLIRIRSLKDSAVDVQQLKVQRQLHPLQLM